MSQQEATEQAWEIEVTEDGPYVVTGGVPLTRRRRVVADDGTPLTWQSTEELGSASSYSLCRCGRSDDKPFCDGSHAEGFEGAETAPTTSYEERARSYEGTGVTLRDDRGLCEHAGFCANKQTNVWKMTGSTGDARVRAEMMAMVDRCPSGALSLRVGEQDVEPDLRPAIGVVDDGPLAVTGGPGGSVTVVRVDGTRVNRSRMTLCRCGASDNKPWCDGSHAETGFHDR